MAEDRKNRKLVNVTFDEEIHDQLTTIAKTRSSTEGKNVTVTEVVREAAEDMVRLKYRDHEFRQAALDLLERQRAQLSD